MRKVWAMRKNEEAVSPVIATILMVAITVVLAAVLYVMVLAFILPSTGGVIGTVPDSEANNHIWRVTALSGASILRSDVYVQLKNASGFVIQTELLSAAAGTHGFGYQAASTGDYVAVGDVFTLSKTYAQGTTITLVNLGATTQYCVLKV